MNKVRKLNQEEHEKTRSLWERVFVEDSKEFLDYYYKEKTKDNEIYVIEVENNIVAMLHLNPYEVRLDSEIQRVHYIVAVATDKRYRRRGMMAALMNHALYEMKSRGEKFTFLMPANEKYYLPFGFRTIQKKKECRYSKTEINKQQITFIKALDTDCEELATYANDYMRKYNVVTYRSAGYYRRLLLEHECEDGGILIARENKKIVGIIPYFVGEQVEIKGEMSERDEVLHNAISFLEKAEEKVVLSKEYPYMIKILDPQYEHFFENAKFFFDEVV